MGCGFQDVDYIVSFRLTWATVRTCLKITKATIKREVEKFIKFPEISKDNKIMISCTPKLSRCFISWRQRNGLLFIKLYGTQLMCSFFICSRCLQSQINTQEFSTLVPFVSTLVYGPSETLSACNREANCVFSGKLCLRAVREQTHPEFTLPDLCQPALQQGASSASPSSPQGCSAFLRRA